MPTHASVAGLSLHDVFQYVGAADPGPVGAEKNWLDTAAAPTLVWKRRNGTNTGWIVMNPAGSSTVPAVADTATIDLALAGTVLSATAITGATATTLAAGDHAHAFAPPDPLTTAVLSDHFAAGTVEDGEIGELGWSASGFAVVRGVAEAERTGVLLLSTAASTAVCYLSVSGAASTVSVDDTFDLAFAFRLFSVDTTTVLRLGLLFPVGSTPTAGIYLLKNAAATTMVGAAIVGTTQVTTASLGGLASGAWHTARLRRTSGTAVAFSLDGGTELSLSSGLPTGLGTVSLQVVPSIAAAKTIDLDYVGLVVAGLVR